MVVVKFSKFSIVPSISMIIILGEKKKREERKFYFCVSHKILLNYMIPEIESKYCNIKQDILS